MISIYYLKLFFFIIIRFAPQKMVYLEIFIRRKVRLFFNRSYKIAKTFCKSFFPIYNLASEGTDLSMLCSHLELKTVILCSGVPETSHRRFNARFFFVMGQNRANPNTCWYTTFSAVFEITPVYDFEM